MIVILSCIVFLSYLVMDIPSPSSHSLSPTSSPFPSPASSLFPSSSPSTSPSPSFSSPSSSSSPSSPPPSPVSPSNLIYPMPDLRDIQKHFYSQQEGTKKNYVLVKYVDTKGIGDRIRSLVIGYCLAYLLQRNLLVLPILYDPTRDLFGMNPSFEYFEESAEMNLTDVYELSREEQTDFSKVNFEKLEKHKVIIVKENIAKYRRLTQSQYLMKKKSFPIISQLILRRLIITLVIQDCFRFGNRTKAIVEKIEKEYYKEGDFRIALHLRSGDSQFGNGGQARQRMAKSELPEFLDQILFVQREFSIPTERLIVFITSDHKEYQEEMGALLEQKKIRYFTSDLYAPEPNHVRTKMDQTRTTVDWALITRTHFVVAMQSGFSQTAALYNCLPIIQKCKSSQWKVSLNSSCSDDICFYG